VTDNPETAWVQAHEDQLKFFCRNDKNAHFSQAVKTGALIPVPTVF
jgi:hypothetical protein